MFSILQRYVYRQLLSVFGLTFGGFTLIMLVGSLYKPLSLGLPPSYLPRVVVLYLPYALAWTTPISLLAACTAAYGRMGNDNELTVIQTSGIHLFPIILPALLLGIIFSAAGLYLNNVAAPISSLARRNLGREIIERAPLMAMFSQDPIIKIPGTNSRVFAWDIANNRLDITVFQEIGEDVEVKEDYAIDKDQEEIETKEIRRKKWSIIRAKGSTIERSPDRNTIVMKLGNGTAHTFDPGDRRSVGIQFRDAAIEFDRCKEQDKKMRPKYYTTRDLWNRLKDPSNDTKSRTRGLIEVHRRQSVALSCLAFAIIGIPLGMISRKGNRMIGFGVALGVMFFIFYPLLLAGEGLSKSGTLPPWLGMWMPDIAVGVIGIYLLVKVLRK